MSSAIAKSLSLSYALIFESVLGDFSGRALALLASEEADAKNNKQKLRNLMVSYNTIETICQTDDNIEPNNKVYEALNFMAVSVTRICKIRAVKIVSNLSSRASQSDFLTV